ncbi:MAG: hypothetical protein M1819_001676 [Sarea resinae]|nr:MAG: hypothetical protein M1819_001676 [Sarea resinae]
MLGAVNTDELALIQDMLVANAVLDMHDKTTATVHGTIADKRLRYVDLSLGAWMLKVAGLRGQTDAPTDFIDFRDLFNQYASGDLDSDGIIKFRAETKKLRQRVLNMAHVIFTTCSNAADAFLPAEVEFDVVAVDDAAKSNMAHVIFTTCLNAADAFLRAEVEFDVVAVDEAAKAAEHDLWNVLAEYRPRVVLMVGDQRQLHPMAIAPPSCKSFTGNLQMFPFARLPFCGLMQMMFEIQHRIFPALGDLVSRLSYEAAKAAELDLWSFLAECLSRRMSSPGGADGRGSSLRCLAARTGLMQILFEVQHRMFPALGDLVSRISYDDCLQHAFENEDPHPLTVALANYNQNTYGVDLALVSLDILPGQATWATKSTQNNDQFLLYRAAIANLQLQGSGIDWTDYMKFLGRLKQHRFVAQILEVLELGNIKAMQWSRRPLVRSVKKFLGHMRQHRFVAQILEVPELSVVTGSVEEPDYRRGHRDWNKRAYHNKSLHEQPLPCSSLATIGGDLSYNGPGIYLHVISPVDASGRYYLYVGKSTTLRDRIKNHENPRYHRNNPGLHYATLDEHATRKSVFVVLTKTALANQPLMQDELSKAHLMCLLDTWMALVFKSLQPKDVNAIFPADVGLGHLGTGLNIGLPLTSVSRMPKRSAMSAFEQLRFSADPAVLSYYRAQHRKAQAVAKANQNTQKRDKLLSGGEFTVKGE